MKMSSQEHASNPLLGDPSIIQVSKESNQDGLLGTSLNQETMVSGGSVEPGSALSKLLDSAMAKAAEESTPELEPRSSSNSPFTNSLSSPSNSTKKNHENVYTVEFLLELRKLPHVKDYSTTNELPEKSFWRAKTKAQNSSVNTKEFNANSKHGNNNSKNKNSFNKKRQDSASNWQRKPGFLKTNDLDALSEDKISQLLGEPTDELEPEWESADLNDELNINMGQTVEDFEKWKSQMRSEERRKNGEVIEDTELVAENSGNAVDNFFSFVKPKNHSVDSTNSSIKGTHSSLSTPSVPHSEPSTKSSRFSSFFSNPSSDNRPQLPRQEVQQHPQPQPQSQPPIPQPQPPILQTQSPISQSQRPSGNPDQGFSRFLSMMDKQNGVNNASHQPLPLQNENSLDASKHIPGPPLNNDSFFMSLLSRKEGPDGSKQPSSPAMFNKVPTQAKPALPMSDVNQSPLTTNVQALLHSQQAASAMQQQQQRKLSQGQQMNQQSPTVQHLPPWMKQFQAGPNGPSNAPLNGHPNASPNGPPNGPPNIQNGPLPPHMQYPPNMGPPPKMFPPGFMPPPGMPMPPQFANGRNVPMPPLPNQNHPNHPLMGFPPGMPIPPGMGMPPVQQHNGFDQRNQHPDRR